MFKAGWAMIISGVLLGIGWAIYNLWQAGNIEFIVAIICAVLFIGGAAMIGASIYFGQ